MRCNVGGMERTVRIILGVALFGLGLWGLSGALSVITYVIGGIALVTGIVAYCPATSFLGMNTCRRRH